MKGREVELESISSRLQVSKDSQETGDKQVPQKKERNRREKRGCPKSERKELDKELYKRVKKSSSTNGTADSSTDQHDIFRCKFQKKKLNKFKNGEYLDIIYYFYVGCT